MKKLLCTLMILVASFTLTAQSFFEEWANYEAYCSELVPDTITITGTLVQKAIPLNDEQGKLISYVMVSCGDTTWDAYKCKEFKEDDSYNSNWGTVVWNGNWGTVQVKSCNETTKKVICQIKRRQPELDMNFIIWLKAKK